MNHAECKCDFDNCNNQISPEQNRCGTFFDEILRKSKKPEIVMSVSAGFLLVVVVVVDVCWFLPRVKNARKIPGL